MGGGGGSPGGLGRWGGRGAGREIVLDRGEEVELAALEKPAVAVSEIHHAGGAIAYQGANTRPNRAGDRGQCALPSGEILMAGREVWRPDNGLGSGAWTQEQNIDRGSLASHAIPNGVRDEDEFPPFGHQ